MNAYTNNIQELRIYIIFRADLPEMTRAKGEVQAAHAASSIVYQAMLHDSALTRRYIGRFSEDERALLDGQVKIIMEVADLPTLQRLEMKAWQFGMYSTLIRDAAHTVFEIPIYTCLGLGPCTRAEADKIFEGFEVCLRK